MSEHYLRFLANEDEAQMTGYKFVIDGNDAYVSETFHHSEYETSPKRYAKDEARKLWRKLIDSGEFEEIIPTLSQILAKAKGNFGFLTLTDVKVIAKEDRLKMLLVRCNNCRFLAPAQNIQHLVDIIERDGKDYVRDISIPVS